MVEGKNITKRYGFNKVLDGVNFKLNKGMVYGLVGENGAGKTTLFRSILGLETHGGEVVYSEGVKKRTGYLMTDPYYFPYMKGVEYMRFLAEARGEEYISAGSNLFDLPLDEFVSGYSTGMKKKLSFQAMLLQKNNFYILDEPFNGVDLQGNMLIMGVVEKLKTAGCTFFISSHILSTLTEMCDEILVMKNKVIEQTIEKGAYAELEKSFNKEWIDRKLSGLK